LHQLCLFGAVVGQSAYLARIAPPHTVLSDDATSSNVLTQLVRDRFVEPSSVPHASSSSSASPLVGAQLPAASPASSLQSAIVAANDRPSTSTAAAAAALDGGAWRLTRPRAGDKPERPLAASVERIDEVVADAMIIPLNALMNETALYVASGEGRIILVEGRPGLGKNLLRRCYVQRVQKSSFASLLLCESGVDALPATPFSVWVPIFEQLVAHAIEPLKLPVAFDTLASQFPVLNDLCAEDESVLALLNDVLPFAFPINARSRRAAAAAAARQHDSALLHSAARLLALLLVELLDTVPKLIVLGSAVHIDSTSWRVIKELQQSELTPLVVVFRRPVAPLTASSQSGDGDDSSQSELLTIQVTIAVVCRRRAWF
jgi:hypothetical protein